MEHWVAEQLGSALVSRRSVAGGCSHSSWQLRLADGRRLFAKSGPVEVLPQLAAEAEGLRALAVWAAPPLRLPEPLALGVSAEACGDQAVLVMPWLALQSGGTDGHWMRLGAALAALHRASTGGQPVEGYGFASDNAIGGTAQANGWRDHWGRFFVERRLGPQLALAEARGQPFREGDRLLEWAAAQLERHHCEATLVHGDLWSGNAGLLADGGVALFDPAVYWGDREVDLGMARLFGGFPRAFFQGYEAIWPLPQNWSQRLDLYNLYHLLNHAHLFGGGYRGQAERVIRQLLG